MVNLRALLFLVAASVAMGLASGRAGSADGPLPYDAFVKGAQAQRGLFTVWRKDGKVYLELAAAQLDHDFVQTIVPATGLGGHAVVWGNTDHLPTELVRFERAGNSVAILWPSPYWVAPRSPAAQRAIGRSFARSVVGLAPIAAVDEKTGNVVIDAAPFLDDQLNLKSVLAQALHEGNADPYVLLPERSYFGKVKAFPENVFIEAKQAWTSPTQRVDDALADPRYLQLSVAYNIADPPGHADYRPRYADDRVGIYDDVYLSFDDDRVLSRKLRYIVRWDLQPSDPSKPVSPAAHPMVFYLSDTIPERYRPAIRAAVLKWNDAFLKLGISDALQVLDQPTIPIGIPTTSATTCLRWVTEYDASFGADSQTLYDPRTGEEFRTGVLISADVPLYAQREWTYAVDPARYGRSTDPMPQKFLDDVWLATIMHETGHNLGMQHNFIGSRAYTAKQLQDPDFTSKYGIASTVMEYAPANLWPRTLRPRRLLPNGAWARTITTRCTGPTRPCRAPRRRKTSCRSLRALGAARGRTRAIATPPTKTSRGATDTPPTRASNRTILTNDPLGWCRVRFVLDRDLIAGLNAREPAAGEAYEAETDAFRMLMGDYGVCALVPAHYIGGQYLSRAHRGDPRAEPPIVPVPRAEQRRAFDLLDAYVFSSKAWRLPPSLLDRLGYSEWAGYGYVGFEGYGNLPQWAYEPPERHDLPYAERVANLQSAAIRQMFQPLVLARIADASLESTDPNPMRLSDLFAWMHAAVFREFAGGGTELAAIDRLRRTLQIRYAETLAGLYRSPAAGTPEDARALARADLVALESETARALRVRSLDPVTRAQLEWLRARAHSALDDGR